MIEVATFVDGLKSAGVEFFAGVPDSLQKSICAYVTDTCGENYVIATNGRRCRWKLKWAARRCSR